MYRARVIGEAISRQKRTAEIQLAIEAAIQDFVGKGLVADSGQRRWSERTGRYEIVWASTGVGETLH
jgi:hypothetical protein